jgi:hypothetical protein
MKRLPRLRNTSSELSESVQKRVNAYALAATATGVGMLALAQPAEARVVYTPAHKTIGPNTSLNLDLTNHGFVDFVFANSLSGGTANFYLFPGNKSFNEVWGLPATGSAAALRAGALIKPARFFSTHTFVMVQAVRTHGGTHTRGQWQNVKNRYLGLKFSIKGKAHYGWARLNVAVHGLNITATLTGYAYETITNKPIIAGKTNGGDEASDVEQPSPTSLTAPAPEPATLGLLAMGAPGLSIWRREETVIAGQ